MDTFDGAKNDGERIMTRESGKRLRFAGIFLLSIFLFGAGWVSPCRGHDYLEPGGIAPMPAAKPEGGGQPPANHPAVDRDNLDPVGVDRGEFTLEAQDFSLPGRGPALEIRRSYRSQSAINMRFGYGWDLNYNLRLRKLHSGNVVILDGRNRKDEYVFNPADGSFRAPAGIYHALSDDGDGTFSVTDKHGTKYDFDLNGCLSAIVDRNGNALTFTYDPAGKLPIQGTSAYFVNQATGVIGYDYRLTKVTDPAGREISFAYNSDGRLAAVSDFAGRTWRYGYDVAGNLVSVIAPAADGSPDGATTTYAYDVRHNLVSITDPEGRTYLINHYDDQGRVDRQTYGDGTATVAYSPETRATAVTNANGFLTEWTCNSSGNPTRKKIYTAGLRPGDPPFYVSTNEYNAGGELTKTVFPRGNWIKYVYDDRGNLLEMRRKKIDAPDTDDPAGDLVTAFTYEPRFNFVKTATDPNGNVTTYDYDENGNLIRVTYPAPAGGSNEARFAYDAFGQLETIIDPNGMITEYARDPATGCATRIVSDAGEGRLNCVVETTYDPLGNPLAVRDALGRVAACHYDRLGRPIETAAPVPFGFLTRYQYDRNNNLRSVERQADAAATEWQATGYRYTTLDLPAAITDAAGNETVFGYDAIDNRTLVRDAEGNATIYAYDERNLLWKTTDALGNVTEYDYDPNGNLKEIKDARGKITASAYDDFDRLISTTFPDGSTETYAYDKNSNLIRRTDRKGQAFTFAYDGLNRLTAKTLPDGSIVGYRYDPGSRLVEVTDRSGAIRLEYDALSRLTHVTYPDGKGLGYEYDAAGNRTRLVYPDASIVTYAYDELNRLIEVGDNAGGAIALYTYDALSRRTRMEMANGTQATYAYDRINRLTGLINRAGDTLISSFAYAYDRVGNRLTMIVNEAEAHAYGYDDIYQLTSVIYPGGTTTTYQYDAGGNRVSLTGTSGTTTYVVNDLNQYASAGGTTFACDQNGNFIGDGTFTFVYDAENRLTAASRDGLTAAYEYDAFGRRIGKNVNNAVTQYLYDGDRVIAEYDGTGGLRRKFVHGPGIDEPILMDDGAGAYYYHFDGLGSVTDLTGGTGLVAERCDYDVFGRPDAAGTFGNPHLFTAREYDSETGLYYYRARHFHPGLGRFLQPDPLGCAAGMNLYTYVNNNPVNAVDPLGLVTVIVHGIGHHGKGYSGGIKRALESSGEQVIEIRWSGFILDKTVYGNVANKILEAQMLAQAKKENLNIIGHSWGTVVVGEVLHGTRIKADNLISLGSPYFDYSSISKSWMNFWSPVDPISWGSAFRGVINPGQFDIYWGVPHLNYWNHPDVINEICKKLKGTKWKK